MRRSAFPIFVLAALAATPVLGQSADTPASMPSLPAPTTNPSYEFRGGRWIPVTPSNAPVATDETLDRAEDYLQRRGWRAARKLLLRWFETHDKHHPLRARATFLLAEVYFQQGNRILAFYHFDEVMDLYPESRLYPSALQRQYDIADEYLKGFKDRFLYLKLIGREDEAIEMLFRIQKRAAGSAIAEKALLRTADYYFATSQFDFAADAYGAFVKAYPRDPVAPLAKLRQAYSQMAVFRGTRFDATPITDARELLSELIVTDPQMARERGLSANVQRIDDAQARKILQTGDWYKKTDQLHGAAYLYRLLIKTYPTSTDAETAQERLDRLPDKAKTDPWPGSERAMEDGASGIANPTTGPATTAPTLGAPTTDAPTTSPASASPARPSPREVSR